MKVKEMDERYNKAINLDHHEKVLKANYQAIIQAVQAHKENIPKSPSPTRKFAQVVRKALALDKSTYGEEAARMLGLSGAAMRELIQTACKAEPEFLIEILEDLCARACASLQRVDEKMSWTLINDLAVKSALREHQWKKERLNKDAFQAKKD